MKYELNGQWYTPRELSELCGIKPHTIRDRLRRGYSLEQAMRVTPTDEGVEAFCEASCWTDWIGMPINDLHKIYWKWCVSHEYHPMSVQGFSRHVLSKYPLKTVPTRRNDKYYRIIRRR